MAKANIPIYRDMVELLKLLMREVKNMPKADNRTLGDNIINRTLNCIYQLQLAYDSHGNTTIRLQALKAFDTEFSTLCTYLGIMRHHASRKIGKRLVESIDPQWLKMLDIDRENYHKVLPKKRYRQREKIRRRLR